MLSNEALASARADIYTIIHFLSRELVMMSEIPGRTYFSHAKTTPAHRAQSVQSVKESFLFNFSSVIHKVKSKYVQAMKVWLDTLV